jgi:type VI protein secretion system component VasK
MSQNSAFDSSIPVLTEVVLEPVPAAPVGQAGAEPAAAGGEPDAQAALQARPEPDWDELERRIAERVVAQLQPQLDAVVRKALASAGDQIHIGLRQAVEQVVAQQLAAIQFGQKP